MGNFLDLLALSIEQKDVVRVFNADRAAQNHDLRRIERANYRACSREDICLNIFRRDELPDLPLLIAQGVAQLQFFDGVAVEIAINAAKNIQVASKLAARMRLPCYLH